MADSEMTLNEYQQKAATTLKPQCNCREYLAMGLAGETGEVMDHLKRIIRGDREIDDALVAEMGDVLWYLSQLAAFYHITMGDVAKKNLEKLADRQKRGVIAGSGDKR
jgi:NTP pyrophosphatase (non-canonical NTP hydrolase)